MDNKTLVHNPTRAKTRFSPLSTFEIPSSIILLETRQLSSVDQIIPWDQEAYPVPVQLPALLVDSWKSDHSLRTAYQGYCPWLFLSQMKKVPTKDIVRYLNLFNYGQWDEEKLNEGFWLTPDFKLSAIEQVAFLRGLIDRLFGLNIDVFQAVFPALVTEQGKDYSLTLKTGSTMLENGLAFGWAVGYVERGMHRYFFAMNIEMDDYNQLTEKRLDITRAVLNSFGLLSDKTVDRPSAD